jgi:MFS family permease
MQAAGTVLGEPNLRRLNIAYAVVQLGGWAGFVAISLYAFQQGGAREVGVMTAVRLAPTALASPFAGALADHFKRTHVIATIEALRVGTQLGAAAFIIGGVSPVAVYVAVSIGSLAETALDPARAALLPGLARTPEQLTAANALEATIDGGALTLGPALGGLLLSVATVQAVLVVDGAAAALAAVLALMIAEPEIERRAVRAGEIARESLAGFGVILRDRTLRTVVGVFSVQMLAFGLLLVFIVAVPLQELHLGESSVGWFNAATGVGAIAGGVLTMTLAGGRLAPPLLAGLGLIGLSYVAIAAAAVLPVALAAVVIMNLGGCYVDVSTFTLLQRAVPEELLARAFSVIGTVTFAALLVGGVAAPALISVFGLRWALAITGALILGAVAVAASPLLEIDAEAPVPRERLDLLGAVPLFRMLPVPVLERLASSSRERSAAAGEVIIRQGEPGEAYYVIADGHAQVLVDGAQVAELGPGDAFGEIALLMERPRTASVRAEDDMRLEALDRDVFLEVVGGHEDSRDAANAISRARLMRASPAGPFA